MVQINDSNFQEILDSTDLIIVDFWGRWCNPCERLKPILEQLENKYPQIKFYEANIEDNSILRKQFKVMSLPTLIFLKDSEKTEHIAGFRNIDELENIIRKYI